MHSPPPSMWRLSDYDFELPGELIAQRPPARRDDARLLVAGPGAPRDLRIGDLVDLLPAGSILVLNDTRVIPARLRARKPSGGAVELLLIEPVGGDRFRAMARASKPIRVGAALELCDGDSPIGALARVVAARDDGGVLEVELPPGSTALIDRIGEVPLPPYIERGVGGGAERALDRERYQTVYARAPGAVAAPTAGLHFTDELLARLTARGVALATVTLHVGLGTFAPVRVDDLRQHRMHVERYEVPEATAALIASGRPVVAVGTTSTRALEAAAVGPRQVRPGPGATDLFIGPGHRFQVVDRLITNFHLPRSTLLVLCSAFAGRDLVLAAYRHAVTARYRFFSYGDAMLLERAEGA